MTWTELATKIAAMTAAEKEYTVQVYVADDGYVAELADIKMYHGPSVDGMQVGEYYLVFDADDEFEPSEE